MTLTAGMCILAHTDRQPDGTRTPRPEPTKAAAGAQLCTGHIRRLEQDLAEAPALYDRLEAALQPGGSNGPRITGTSTKPLPINPAAAEARTRLRDILTEWTRLVAEERDMHPPTTPTVPRLAGFLLTHHRWIAEQPWVDELILEIREYQQGARWVLNPGQTRRIEIGLCGERPNEVMGELCPGVLIATIRAGQEDAMTVTCPECGQVFEPHQWRALQRRLRGDAKSWLSMSQLGGLLRVEYGTLRYWASQDGWRRIDDGQRKRYDLADAQASFERRRLLQDVS